MAMYTISFDDDARTLRLRLTGFWSVADHARFTADFECAVRRAAREGSFGVLSDCLDYPVQSHEMGVAWGRLLGSDTRITQPYAVVVGSILNKLQAERALTASNVRVFLNMTEAQAWLEQRLAA